MSGAAGLRFAVVTASAAHGALLDERQDRGGVAEQHLDVAGEQIVHRRRRRLVGHVRHLDAGQALQQLGAEMMHRAGPARAVVQPVRLGLGERDQVGDRFHRRIVVDHQEERRRRQQRHRHEILERLVGHLLAHRHVDGHGRAGGLHQRVAVRRRAHDLHGGERRRGARPVLDDERLAELLLELLRDQPRQQVGAAAGGERHHDGHRPRRILLGMRRRREQALQCVRTESEIGRHRSSAAPAKIVIRAASIVDVAWPAPWLDAQPSAAADALRDTSGTPARRRSAACRGAAPRRCRTRSPASDR